MAETFDELVDLSELESSSEIAKFIHKDCGINNYVSTWEYVSYSYSRAFEALARRAFEEGVRGGNLGNPLVFLARHSIELEKSGFGSGQRYKSELKSGCVSF